MTWANVDDLFPEHPKVIAAGGDAAWLYICGLCFVNRNLTEGRIPKAVVPRLSDRKSPAKLASTLVKVGLWHDSGDHYAIHDWDKYNEGAEAVKARKEQARAAAKSRWSGVKKDAPSNAQSMRTASDEHCGEHADRIDLAYAKPPDEQCPPTPLPREVSRSSSSHHGVAPPVAEEEELLERMTTAVRLVAERRLAVREGPPITNATAWLRSVRAEVITDHGDELRHLAGQGLHPKAMAERIMPVAKPASPYPQAGEVSDPVWDVDADGYAVPRTA